MRTLDFRQMTFTETAMVEALEKLWAEGKMPDKVTLSPSQHQQLIDAQPKEITDWETGGTIENPIHTPIPRTIKTVKIYSAPFGDVEIEVKD